MITTTPCSIQFSSSPHGALSFIRLLIELFQVQKAIKFQYTNWTDSQSDQSRFKLLTKMVADHQYDCPLDETVTLMAARFKIFRYHFFLNILN